MHLQGRRGFALWRTEWSSSASRSREQKSAGGIIIPDPAKEKPQEAKVVAVAPGKKEDGTVLTLDVKAGDRVLFGKYAGTEIKLDGEAGHSSLLVRARARERFPLGPDSPSSSAARPRSVDR